MYCYVDEFEVCEYCVVWLVVCQICVVVELVVEWVCEMEVWCDQCFDCVVVFVDICVIVCMCDFIGIVWYCCYFCEGLG